MFKNKTFCEWFDPNNIEHIKAYSHLQKTGVWPIGFIPDSINMDTGWQVILFQKITDEWINYKLNECKEENLMNKLVIQFKKLDNDAKIPTYSHTDDCCCDISSIFSYIIHPGDICLVRTGISISIPKGFEAQIRPRSGLSLSGLSIINSPGTIDCSYRGEICIPLINLGKEGMKISKYDRIAQMKFSKVYKGIFFSVESLDKTERGLGGFGSTGVKGEIDV